MIMMSYEKRLCFDIDNLSKISQSIFIVEILFGQKNIRRITNHYTHWDWIGIGYQYIA